MQVNMSVCVCVRVIQHCRHNMTWLLFIVISFHFVFEPDRFACFLSIILTVQRYAAYRYTLCTCSLSFQQASIYYYWCCCCCCCLVGRLVRPYVCARVHKMMRDAQVGVHSIEYDWYLNFSFTYAILQFFVGSFNMENGDSIATAPTRNATHTRTSNRNLFRRPKAKDIL